MKKVLFASLLIVGAVAIARADSSDDRPGKDWMPLSTVASKLHDMGFDPVIKIEADDGMWKAKAIKDGEAYKIKLDPVTGRVVEQKRKHDDHADKSDKDDHDDD